MQGLHLTADLHGCLPRGRAHAAMTDRAALRDCASRPCGAAAWRRWASCSTASSRPAPNPPGVTGVVLLAESHLAVHLARAGRGDAGRLRVQLRRRQLGARAPCWPLEQAFAPAQARRHGSHAARARPSRPLDRAQTSARPVVRTCKPAETARVLPCPTLPEHHPRRARRALSAMLRSLSMLLAEHRRHGSLPDFSVLRAMLFYVDDSPSSCTTARRPSCCSQAARALPADRQRARLRLDREHARGEGHPRPRARPARLRGARRAAPPPSSRRWTATSTSTSATCASRRRRLPLALKHLSAEDWKELDTAFLANRDPLTGHEPTTCTARCSRRSCRKRRRRSASALR